MQDKIDLSGIEVRVPDRMPKEERIAAAFMTEIYRVNEMTLSERVVSYRGFSMSRWNKNIRDNLRMQVRGIMNERRQ